MLIQYFSSFGVVVEINEQKLNKILKDQSDDFKKHNDLLEKKLERHNKVLYEKFRGDVKILSEGWTYIKDKVEQLTENQEIMSVKLDAVIDMASESKKDISIIKSDVAKNTEDISTIKSDVAKNTEDISTIKSDISIIKYEVKEKIDRDEFAALEKRVILLENKIRKA